MNLNLDDLSSSVGRLLKAISVEAIHKELESSYDKISQRLYNHPEVQRVFEEQARSHRISGAIARTEIDKLKAEIDS